MRQQSNASSIEDDESLGARGGFRGSGSSFDVSPSGSGINIADPGVTHLSGTPPGGGAGIEPMFNFRSLAAMIGHDGEKEDAKHEEHVDESGNEAESGPIRPTQTDDPSVTSEQTSGLVAGLEESDNVAVSDNQSTRTAPDESFHNVLESDNTANVVPPPEVHITAPSRTGSDLISMSKAEEADVISPPASEAIDNTASARPIVS